MNVFLTSLITVAAITLTVIITYELICLVLGSFSKKKVNTYRKPFYAIIFSLFILSLIFVAWIYMFGQKKPVDNIEIKAQLPTNFKKPTAVKINDINSTMTLNEREREKMKNDANDKNNKLVEDALKSKK